MMFVVAWTNWHHHGNSQWSRRLDFLELPSSGDQLMLLQLAVAKGEAAVACTV
jgi:hypothetical protein